MRKVYLVLVAFAAGCAALPKKEQIAAFSDATSKGVASVKSIIVSSEALSHRIDEQVQAQAYMMGRHFEGVQLPEVAIRYPKEQFKIRLTALQDLEAYTKALAKAADQGAIDELQAAAEKVGTSAAALATAVPGGAVAAPALKLGGKVLGYSMSDAYVRDILKVVREVDPVLKVLVDALRADMSGFVGFLDMQATEYAGLRNEQLLRMRQQGRSTRADLYSEYIKARTEIDAQLALAQTAEAADKLLEAIYDTHHALAVGKPDISLTISRMSTIAEDLGSVIKTIETGASK